MFVIKGEESFIFADFIKQFPPRALTYIVEYFRNSGKFSQMMAD
jgi:hypothetical protein